MQTQARDQLKSPMELQVGFLSLPEPFELLARPPGPV